MYQALYRKWRPQTFDEVVGQQHITETLKSQIKSGRLSHAYIFIGTRGTGKTTCARILAKAVNCEHPVNGNPCGACAACRGIADGAVMDVVELDAASNNGVDNVRALREEAVFSPATVKKRVYIIDEVHMLSTPAFNALLKILEEPPEHLMFILATTELQKVPATILSRCQRHQFHRIDAPVIADYLRFIASKESFELSGDAAELIARMADGGVRDALSLMDQCSASQNIDVDAVYSALGLAGKRRITQMLDFILDHDAASALKAFDGMWMDGKDPAGFLDELCTLLRDVMMVIVAPKSCGELISGGFDMPSLKAFAKRMTGEETVAAMEGVRHSIESMRDAGNPRTAAELCLVSLCDNTLGDSVKSLRARISRLEEDIRAGAAAPWREEEAELIFHSPRPTERDDDSDDGEFDEREIDPAVFTEVQPEDAILERAKEQEQKAPPWETKEETGESVKHSAPRLDEKRNEDEKPAIAAESAERKPAPVRPVASIENSGDDGELWDRICEKVSALVTFEVRSNLHNEMKVRARIDGGVLRLEVEPGFLYGRFNKAEILKKFSDAAGELLGREVNTLLSELKAQPQSVRSLDELEKFAEVKIK